MTAAAKYTSACALPKPMHEGFESFSAEINRITALRDSAASEAFAYFEQHRSAIAGLLMQTSRDRAHAMRWMSTHHRELDGRNGYQLLANGEDDYLWDVVARMCGLDNQTDERLYRRR